MNPKISITLALLLAGAAARSVSAAGGPAAGETADVEALRSRFVEPPKNAGTTTLWWLNGRLTKEEIRRQLLTLRDRDGFGGVAPLTLFRMKPSTEPAYLSEEYFGMYGEILDTAKELGMSVVFYDDCDFPSGTAGNQMAEKYPDDLMKYLARAKTTVTGPGEAVLPAPGGTLMGVVAKNLETGESRVVTAQAKLQPAVLPVLAGGSAGFRQPPEEESRCELFRVLDAQGQTLLEDRFDGKLSDRWEGAGGSTIAQDGLHATGCMPMQARGLALPAKYTIEARISIVRTAAAIAFGVKSTDDLVFWQFNAKTRTIRPHIRRGGYRGLESVPFPFQVNHPYQIRLEVDGAVVETWIDGKRVASHKLEEAGSAVRWTAPAGQWDVQAFVCATAPGKRFVDCLDPKAMSKFIGLTYDRFARQFPSHFGTTVRMTFYDDLSTYHVPECLAWTPSFNEKFQARFGRSPEALYPALWEDIGAETGAARASLYGLRNELFAAGYPRAVQQWCDDRGMVCSGHPAASYRANPLQSPGDAILFYKYQGAPLTDYIHYYGHGIDGFKIPASAAYNFDRCQVVCEIYGNFHQQLPNDAAMLYRAGMEVYARGITDLLPHGTWWDPAKMRIVPEISWRNPEIGPELPRYNRWAARCQPLLQTGRHV
ncbi:MAG: glycosyl hydrolase family 2 protein, partial [Thermoguttaceae bacterium]